MNQLFKITAGFACLAAIIAFQKTASSKNSQPPAPAAAKSKQSKIQAAILLDVSNSMDGLIDQAKAQLWNMVSVMGKATCDGITPQIEIALYEYGRPANGPENGYVKQISLFSTDLDQLSQKLFGLTTNGGDEYCGHVIYNSLNELNWDTAPGSYKVIFIAGNEDFLQGDIAFTKACEKAKQKGVTVNTIYCGSKMQGIREHWNLGGECGNGSYTNIDENAKLEDIPTPYDSMLFVLNEKLNGTYVAYGYAGAAASVQQRQMDEANMSLNKSAGLKRIAVKGRKELYKNYSWDLVDAVAYDSLAVDKMEKDELPDSLKNKSREEIKRIIAAKNTERTNIQNQIGELNSKREAYITAAKAKQSAASGQPTLETEIEKIIKQQAKRFNMQVQ